MVKTQELISKVFSLPLKIIMDYIIMYCQQTKPPYTLNLF